jgi:type I restriction enzyme, S subunit
MKKGWERKRLGDLAEIELGKTPARANASLWDEKRETGNVWLSIADLLNAEGNVVVDSKAYVSDKGAELCKLVPKGTLLVSFKLTLGRLAFAGRDLFTNEAIAALTLFNERELSKEFLFWFLQFFDWVKAAENDVKLKGMTLNKAKLKEMVVHFPKLLAEQRRIVGILDEAFAGLAIAQAHAEKNLQNARALFESHLNEVFSKKGEGWVEKGFDDCIEDVKYTTKIQRKEFLSDGEFPIISQEAEFINGSWDNPVDLFKVTTPVVIFGDHTKVLKYVDFDFVLGADGVKILQAKPFLLPQFFYFKLRGNPLKSLGYARHFRLLREVRIAYPDMATQRRIVARLDALSAETRRLAALYERKLSALGALKKSLLHRAFAGEL